MTIALKEAQKLLDSKRNDGSILFYEEYKGDKAKHAFICSKCDEVWTATPNKLKRKGNTGCPSCHNKNLANKKNTEKAVKSESSDRLKDNRTLLINEIGGLTEDSKDIIELKLTILDAVNIIKHKELEQLKLNNEYKGHSNSLKRIISNKLNFGLFFALLLIPVWIIYQVIYTNKVKSFEIKVSQSLQKVRFTESEITHLNSNLKELKLNLAQAEEKNLYGSNLARLKNRIKISLGGDTSLYYFSFLHCDEKYYKIGITTYTVYERYRNRDGGHYKAIDKIFFDTKIQDAKIIERLILRVFKDNLAMNKELLARKGGYSEVFTSDVLNLDK